MKRTIILFIFCFCLLSNTTTTHAEGTSSSITDSSTVTKYSDSTPYQYPIVPGTEAWKSFTTVDQMVEACQIPAIKLENMTTEALLETVLDYPLLLHYNAYDSIEESVKIIGASFNGFRELFSRTDVTSTLLNKYSTSYVAQEINSENCTPELFFESSTVEFLLASNEIINGQMSVDDNASFFAIHMRKNTLRAESGLYSTHSNIYDSYSFQNSSNILICSRPDFDSVPDGTIKTPKGNDVRWVQICTVDFTSTEKTKWNQHFDELYPLATRVGSTTGKYNCHSYAWYSRSIHNTYVLTNGNNYINDSSYIRYTGTPYSGVIVDYGNAGHSAVCTGQTHATGEPYVKSKWSSFGLYQHHLSYCPNAMTGTPTYTYYKANY